MQARHRLVGCAAALLVIACQSAPTASPTPSLAPAVDLCRPIKVGDQITPCPLVARRYAVRDFVRPVAFSVGPGWSVYRRTGHDIGLSHEDDTSLLIVGGVRVGGGEGGPVRIAPRPEAIMDFLAGRPEVTIGGRTDIVIDGRPGIMLDVSSNVGGPQELLIAPPDGAWRAFPGRREALVIVEVDGGLVVISAPFSDGAGGPSVKVIEILESLSFDP